MEKTLFQSREGEREIRLKGEYKLNLSQGQSFTIGKMCMKGLLNIREADLVIDGSDAVLDAEVEDSTGSDWALIFVQSFGAECNATKSVYAYFRKESVAQSAYVVCDL